MFRLFKALNIDKFKVFGIFTYSLLVTLEKSRCFNIEPSLDILSF